MGAVYVSVHVMQRMSAFYTAPLIFGKPVIANLLEIIPTLKRDWTLMGCSPYLSHFRIGTLL